MHKWTDSKRKMNEIQTTNVIEELQVNELHKKSERNPKDECKRSSCTSEQTPKEK